MNAAEFFLFFYLSKIIWFLAQPLNLAIFLLVFSLLVALLGWRKLGGFTALEKRVAAGEHFPLVLVE